MTAEELVRLYNVGAFHRSLLGSPPHRLCQVTIGGETTMMALSEIEEILVAQKERVAIVMAREEPVPVAKVVQPRRLYG